MDLQDFVFLVLLLMLGLSGVFYWYSVPQSPTTNESDEPPQPPAPAPTLTPTPPPPPQQPPPPPPYNPPPYNDTEMTDAQNAEMPTQKQAYDFVHRRPPNGTPYQWIGSQPPQVMETNPQNPHGINALLTQTTPAGPSHAHDPNDLWNQNVYMTRNGKQIKVNYGTKPPPQPPQNIEPLRIIDTDTEETPIRLHSHLINSSQNVSQ